MNDDKLAALLYPNTTPNAAPTSAPQPTAEDVMAEKLYGSKPTAPVRSAQRDDRPMAELTDDEQAERIYGGTDPAITHSVAVQALVNASVQDHLLDPEEAREIATEWSHVFKAHNLNATQSAELAEIGASVMSNPPSAELVETWTETAIANLQSEYGTNGTAQALADARAYVASVPGAADMLDNLGLGSHPKVVAIAAARGRALRQAGKLR